MSNFVGKTAKEIQCLARLAETTTSLQEVMSFLLKENFITKADGNKVLSAPSPAKELQILLASLSSDGKFQMLEYEWKLLPAEEIKLTIVTDKEKVEFTYSSF